MILRFCFITGTPGHASLWAGLLNEQQAIGRHVIPVSSALLLYFDTLNHNTTKRTCSDLIRVLPIQSACIVMFISFVSFVDVLSKL